MTNVTPAEAAAQANGFRVRWTRVLKRQEEDFKNVCQSAVPSISHIKAIKAFLLEKEAVWIPTLRDLEALIVDENDLDDESYANSKIFIETRKLLEDCEAMINPTVQPTPNIPTPPVKVEVKLPTLNMPIFKGEILEFDGFWQSFETIHDNPGLSAKSKLSYLIGQLKGAPLTLLSRFDGDGNNYTKAVELLKERFGQRVEIKHAHYTALLSIANPTTKLASLEEFQNQLECNLQKLETLQVDFSHQDFSKFVAFVLAEKLPSSVLGNMRRNVEIDEWDLDNLREQLAKEIKHQATVQTRSLDSRPVDSKPRQAYSKPYGDSRVKPTVGVFQVCATSQGGCLFCSENHASANCQKYPTARNRIARVGELGLCYRCLAHGHPIGQCQSQRTCSKCKGVNHHELTCLRSREFDQPWRNDSRGGSGPRPLNNSPAPPKNNQQPPVTRPDNAKHAVGTTVAFSCSSDNVALPTAQVQLVTHDDGTYTRGLLDQGSQRSFILHELANQIRIFGTYPAVLAIDGFGSPGEMREYNIVRIAIETKDRCTPIEAVVVDHLPDRMKVIGLENLARKCVNRGIIVADNYDDNAATTFGILIGNDFYSQFVKLPSIDGTSIIESEFGTLFSGPVNVKGQGSQVTSSNIVTALNIGVHTEQHDIDALWNLESIGISGKEVHPDDALALQNFESSIKYDCGKYMAKLPWKAECNPLPSNYGLAKGRLLNNLKRLRASPSKLEQYHKVIMDQVEHDFIEEVHDIPAPQIKPVHYLAHHAVEKNSVTTPIRVVFDCSAKSHSGSVSLNDCLYSGPQLVPEMTQILMRFRLEPYAVTADIRKAFLMIGLDPSDRDVTRFLWPKDPSDPFSPILTYRFKVILFGATCSQFILNATILHHLQGCLPEHRQIANALARNIYVDNVFCSAADPAALTEFYEKSKAIMNDANLQLREWATNSLETRVAMHADGELDGPSVVPVLGLQWNTDADQLTLAPHPVDRSNPTKRKVLRGLASQFDPLGIMSPIILHAKLLVQDIWKEQFMWDDPLPDEYVSRWEEIADELEQLSNIPVPRAELRRGNTVLHAFADASMLAYGTMVYGVQDKHSSLLIAKGRVAPLKELTVPRLELMALVLAARLINYVIETYQNEFVIEDIHIWSDSLIALGYIQSRKTLTTFEQNRVDEIRRRLPNAKFHYVNTKENPADIISRGARVKELRKSNLWWHGPKFLCEDLPPEAPLQEDNVVACLATTQVPVAPEESMLAKLVQNCSSLSKVLRTLVTVRRCLQRWNPGTRGNATPLSAVMSKEEIISAERWLIIRTQHEAFGEVIKFLGVPRRKPPPPPMIKQLNLQWRDDLVVCVSRLSLADISDSAKYPILLPSKHRTTELIILDAHLRNMHMSTNALVAHLRERFWIPKARQRIKTIVSKCVPCRKLLGGAYSKLPVPPLPRVRVLEGRPFATTGVDYGGPIITKTNGIEAKRYIALFTCASTRAVHLELADDLSVEAFLHVLHRFVARRSYPSVMISDNGTNFIGTAKVLQAWEEHPSVRNELNAKHCSWRFIPSRAPWHGGFYERLIGMTKTVLRKAIGASKVTDCELSTLLCRIEAQLNDRPLTYQSDRPDDALPLTPSMLMHGYRIDSIPTPIMDPDELEDPNVIDKSWVTHRQRHNELLLERMWGRWRREYLLMLRSTAQPGPTLRLPQVHDVVMIHDEGPRVQWQLGRITELIPGVDGHVRSARVKTSQGVLVRSVLKLYPLELESLNGEAMVEGGGEEHGNEIIHNLPVTKAVPGSTRHLGGEFPLVGKRYPRKASLLARKRITAQTDLFGQGECVSD